MTKTSHERMFLNWVLMNVSIDVDDRHWIEICHSKDPNTYRVIRLFSASYFLFASSRRQGKKMNFWTCVSIFEISIIHSPWTSNDYKVFEFNYDKVDSFLDRLYTQSTSYQVSKNCKITLKWEFKQYYYSLTSTLHSSSQK